MRFSVSDLSIIVIYFLVSFLLGLLLRKRGSSSLTEYFLSGRRAPWWLAGTGMVATTFAADTPLTIAGIVGNQGIAGNWIWWSSAAGGMLTVFFFSRLWRRAGVMTDLELIELRYDGAVAKFLRGFKAVYFGLLINSIVIGWVNLAMMKILRIVFPEIDPAWSLMLFAFITVVYVSLSGLWGVAAADVFQFVTAMTGSILLAYFAFKVPALSSPGGTASLFSEETLRFFPHIATASSASPIPAGYALPFLSFVAFLGIQWWASWYPGAEPGGGGYVAQRIMSARNEREGMLASLWFVTAHYALRPWPWILAGLAAMVLYPELVGGAKEDGYVYLIRDVLPSPFRGLLVAAFAGAYMSTISTQLNWGASYLINDLYRRFVVVEEEEKHYLVMARVVTFLILALSLFITFRVLGSIKEAWELLLEFGAGSGFVLILRWFWWRINAVSELVSIIVPALLTLLLHWLGPDLAALMREGSSVIYFLSFPGSLFVVVPLTILITLIATFATPAESPSVLRRFYGQVHPPGPGWREVSGEKGAKQEKIPLLLAGWISGTLFVYSVLFFIGSFLLGKTDSGWLFLAAALLSGIAVYGVIRKEFRNEEERKFLSGKDAASEGSGDL